MESIYQNLRQELVSEITICCFNMRRIGKGVHNISLVDIAEPTLLITFLNRWPFLHEEKERFHFQATHPHLFSAENKNSGYNFIFFLSIYK